MKRVILTLALFLMGAISYATEQRIQFEVRGLEFRQSNTLPADNAELGYIVNAWNSYQAKCDALLTNLPSSLGESFISFDCGTDFVKETAQRNRRRQYSSQATLILQSGSLFALPQEKISGPHTKARDHKVKFPWQASRKVARQGYDDACTNTTISAQEEHQENFLYFDCGAMIESGVSDGWLYTSQPTLYLKSKPSSTEEAE